MKIVINTCYGGFNVSDEALKVLGLEWYDITPIDPRLISLIEERGSEFVSGENAELSIVEIPDNATDYEVIEEGSGYEMVICVIDGKIHYLDPI